MCNRKKISFRVIPTFIVSAGLFIGAALKIAGVHPMTPHFTEMGLRPYLPVLVIVEILCLSLFLFKKTIKVGLLLLTAYFGGAMAAEMPYHMIAAPAVVLLIVWVTAFIRMPQLFMNQKTPSYTTA